MDPITAIGGLLGPVIGIVGSILTAKEQRKLKELEYKHEVDKFEHEVTMRQQERIAAHEGHEDAMEANQQQTEATLAVTATQGSYDGLIESIKADAQLKGGTIVDALRASVRPVLTYGTVIAGTFLCWYGVTNEVKDAASWTLLTNGSMAFAWWFGDRSAVKLNSRFLK